MAPVRLTACPLCGGAALRPLRPPRRTIDADLAAGCGLARCDRCGLEFTTPRPDDAALAAFYRGRDYTAREPIDDAAAHARAAAQLALIERAGGRLAGARVLDVGCGGGQLLAAARARGATVCGVDPSPHAMTAGAALGVEIAPDLAALADRRFDVVVMSHALEHVPDLRATLAALRGALTDDGRLCVEVPNLASLRARLSVPALIDRGADERHRAFPIHLYYFTPTTLARALGDVGLAVRAQRTTGLGLGALRPGRGADASADADADADDAAAAKADVSPSPRAAPRPGRRLYAAAKAGFHRALLGENLVVVATARAPQARE